MFGSTNTTAGLRVAAVDIVVRPVESVFLEGTDRYPE
jgi:hypothetical protein